jgi:hypothetical protein
LLLNCSRSSFAFCTLLLYWASWDLAFSIISPHQPTWSCYRTCTCCCEAFLVTTWSFLFSEMLFYTSLRVPGWFTSSFSAWVDHKTLLTDLLPWRMHPWQCHLRRLQLRRLTTYPLSSTSHKKPLPMQKCHQ